MKIKDIPLEQMGWYGGFPYRLGPWVRGRGDVIGFQNLLGTTCELSFRRRGRSNDFMDFVMDRSDLRMGTDDRFWTWGELDIIYIKEAVRYFVGYHDAFYYKVTNLYFTERANVLHATVPMHPITIGTKDSDHYTRVAPLTDNRMISLGLEKALCLEEYYTRRGFDRLIRKDAQHLLTDEEQDYLLNEKYFPVLKDPLPNPMEETKS